MSVVAGSLNRILICFLFSLILSIVRSQDTPVDLPKDMKPVYGSADRVTEDLSAHGIGLSEDELIAFLSDGLPKMTGMPERPVEKSQLIIDAMAQLAKIRSQKAVRVISRIARFDRTIGAFKLIEFDVSKTSQQAREEFRIRAYRLIQYNAINALGLIGDAGSAELIRAVLLQEKAPGAQIQYALCLASLGDASGVDNLVSLINLQNRRESAAAAKAFYYITGQDFGYTEDSPIRARKALPARYNEWWNQYRSSFLPDPEIVRERRLNSNQNKTYAPRSTRDLLKLASNYFDFNNTTGSADARKTIKAAGASFNDEFQRIALDPMEDLDVRAEALNWYFEANRSDPLDILKKLRRDENPEIVDKANTLLEQIAEEQALKNTAIR